MSLKGCKIKIKKNSKDKIMQLTVICIFFNFPSRNFPRFSFFHVKEDEKLKKFVTDRKSQEKRKKQETINDIQLTKFIILT